jgi:hypothetical protein
MASGFGTKVRHQDWHQCMASGFDIRAEHQFEQLMWVTVFSSLSFGKGGFFDRWKNFYRKL